MGHLEHRRKSPASVPCAIQFQSTRDSRASARRESSDFGQYCPTAVTPASSNVVSMEESSQFQTRSPVRMSTKW